MAVAVIELSWATCPQSSDRESRDSRVSGKKEIDYSDSVANSFPLLRVANEAQERDPGLKPIPKSGIVNEE
jgi:hypothetical protein